MSAAYDWYRRNYPEGPEYEPRLFDVLTSIAAVYNLSPAGKGRRADGGFRPYGSGVEIRIGWTELSTHDGDGLTRLVIAAHAYRCRVSLHGTSAGYIAVRVQPWAVGDANWLSPRPHPGLDALIGKCEQTRALQEEVVAG